MSRARLPSCPLPEVDRAARSRSPSLPLSTVRARSRSPSWPLPTLRSRSRSPSVSSTDSALLVLSSVDNTEPNNHHHVHETLHKLDSNGHVVNPLPPVPASLSQKGQTKRTFNIIDVWEQRLIKQKKHGLVDMTVHTTPRTILLVSTDKMENLIPKGVPNPLYAPVYAHMTDEFILDQISEHLMDFHNPSLNTPSGVELKTMSGKELVFKRDSHTGKLTVNGVEVLRHQLLNDHHTLIILIEDFLFNHVNQIETAYKNLASINTHGSMSSAKLDVPRIPEGLKTHNVRNQVSELLEIWQHHLSTADKVDPTEPKTILVVTPAKMDALIPRNGPNPFNSRGFEQMRKEFILDHISEEMLNASDPALMSPTGLILTTMSGKKLIFQRIVTNGNQGRVTVNGATIERYLRGGHSYVYFISDFLFHYEDKIRDAMKTLSSPSGHREVETFDNHREHVKLDSSHIPKIPASLMNTKLKVNITEFLRVWSNHEVLGRPHIPMSHNGHLQQVKLILAVPNSKLMNLVAVNSSNPLYDTHYQRLTDEFIKDHLSYDLINFNHRHISSPSGVTLTTLSGKSLVFKRDKHTGKFTVNGIGILDHQLISWDQTNIIFVDHMLFDNYQKIQKAYLDLLHEHRKISIEFGQAHNPVIVPEVPTILESTPWREELSSTLDVWENRVLQMKRAHSPVPLDSHVMSPKIILAVQPSRMMHAVSPNVQNPLYNEAFVKMTDRFILDHLSDNTINLNDQALASPNGITLKTLSGKDLVFKKDFITGKITINGIIVDNHHLFRDGTNIFIIDDFLFHHFGHLQSALAETVKVLHVIKVVPDMPDYFKNGAPRMNVPEFSYLWQNRLTRRKRTDPELSTNLKLGLILAVPSSRMASLMITQNDHQSLLYTSDYELTVDNLLLDHLSEEWIDLNDLNLYKPSGVTLTSLSGMKLVFKKTNDGRKVTNTVNGVNIENQFILPDATQVLILSDLLSDHYDKMKTAQATLQMESELVPTINEPHGQSEQLQLATSIVPKIPHRLDDHQEHPEFPLGDIWKARLSRRDKTEPHLSAASSSSFKPRTILSVTPLKMMFVPSQSTENPLYNPSYDKLTDEFILDHLSHDTIDYNDPHLTSTHGVTLKTLSGKDLIFKKNLHTGKVTINGIDIKTHEVFDEKTNLIIISDFLFDHYQNVLNAYQALHDHPSQPPSITSVEGEGTENEKTTTIPQIPSVLRNGDHRIHEMSSLLDVWKNRLMEEDKLSDSHVHHDDLDPRPKTILAVSKSRMMNVVPSVAQNPLYSKLYDGLTDRFILDLLSEESINWDDPLLTSLTGVTLNTMSGKYLNFKKDLVTGKFTVNGRTIDSHYQLRDNTNIIIISDFLFDHKNAIQSAHKSLVQSGTSNGLHNERENLQDAANIPRVPTILSNVEPGIDLYGLLDVWENRLFWIDRNAKTTRSPYVSSDIKTIVAVKSSRMENLVPKNAPNPLFTPTQAKMTDGFLRDHFSRDGIDFSDAKLNTPAGVQLRSMNGKTLVVRNDFGSGLLTVNGVDVAQHQTLPDGTSVMIIDGYLFDHYEMIQKYFTNLCQPTIPFT